MSCVYFLYTRTTTMPVAYALRATRRQSGESDLAAVLPRPSHVVSHLQVLLERHQVGTRRCLQHCLPRSMPYCRSSSGRREVGEEMRRQPFSLSQKGDSV